MKYKAVLFGILVVSLAMIFTLVAPAGDVSADSEEEIDAYFNDVNVSEYDTPENALVVDGDEILDVRVTASQPIVNHEIKIYFTDFTDYFAWTASSEIHDDPQTSYGDSVEVADYAEHGSGIYKVTASAQLENGDLFYAEAYVKINGGSTFEIIAWALTIVGLLGLAISVILIWPGILGTGWCGATIPLAAVLTTVAMVTGSAGSPSSGVGETTGDDDTPQASSGGQDISDDSGTAGAEGMPQVHFASQGSSGGGIKFRPRISILSIGFAILTAVGFILLLQQKGTVYLTTTVVVLSLVLALVVGFVLPTLAMTFSRKGK